MENKWGKLLVMFFLAADASQAQKSATVNSTARVLDKVRTCSQWPGAEAGVKPRSRRCPYFTRNTAPSPS